MTFYIVCVVQESLIHVDNPDEESADMASGAQEQLDTLKDNMEQNGGTFTAFTFGQQPEVGITLDLCLFISSVFPI